MESYEQLKFFILFILNGLIIGIVFDLFRALRKTFKTSDIVTYIEDIIFWIISGLLSIVFIFTFNQGEIRNYTVLGIIFGVIFYILLFSHLILNILTKFLNLTKNLIIFILNPIIHILKKVCLIFKRFYKYI